MLPERLAVQKSVMISFEVLGWIYSFSSKISVACSFHWILIQIFLLSRHIFFSPVLWGDFKSNNACFLRLGLVKNFLKQFL